MNTCAKSRPTPLRKANASAAVVVGRLGAGAKLIAW